MNNRLSDTAKMTIHVIDVMKLQLFLLVQTEYACSRKSSGDIGRDAVAALDIDQSQYDIL